MAVRMLVLLVTVVGVKSLLCWGCSVVMGVVAKTTELLIPNGAAIEVLTAICMRRYDSEKLCKKIGQEIAPLAISNFLSNHMSPWKACSLFCNSTFPTYNHNEEVDRILGAGPHQQVLNLSSSYLQITDHTINPKSFLNVLQISDIHLDVNYVVNSSIYCDYPICCHSENGFPENSGAQAKIYGSKNCDTPPELLDSFLHFIKKQQAVDIILLTGDFSAHNEWEKTSKSILVTEREIENKIRQHFPSSIVLKSEGNNDYFPDHQYDASQLPKLISITNIRVGLELLTFVSLNTIAYDELNLYVLGDQTYTIFQLMLLEQVLQKYNHIYLVGHVPPTFGGAMEKYSVVFRALVTKYSEKIKGQFYGHTHSDQLILHTDPRSGKPANYAFICPSLSPLYIGSSRARVYEIEGGKGVRDYHQYILSDLGGVEGHGWELEYKLKSRYDIADEIFSWQNVELIKQRVFTDKSAHRKYIRTTGLNEELASKSHCNMLDNYSERRKCLNVSSLFSNDRMGELLELAMGQWGYNHLLVR